MLSWLWLINASATFLTQPTLSCRRLQWYPLSPSCDLFAPYFQLWKVRRTSPRLHQDPRPLKCNKFLFFKSQAEKPASWSSGHAFVSEAGDLRFKSRTGQIEHSVAKGSPPLQHFFKWSCVARAQWHKYGPRKLVTRFGAMQRVQSKIWFD